MFKIIAAEFLAADIRRFIIEAPKIVHQRKPGQFVSASISEHQESIPLTISDADEKE